MKISQKQPLLSSALFAIIISVFSIFIFLFYRSNRKVEFYNILKDRVITRQTLMLDMRQLKLDSLIIARKSNLNFLKNEEYGFYNLNGERILGSINSPSTLEGSKIEKIKRNDLKMEADREESIFFIYEDLIKNQPIILYAKGLDKNGLSKENYLGKLLIAGCIITFLISFGFIHFMVKNAMMPLYNIAKKMEIFSSHDLTQKLSESSYNNEIGMMANTFNSLMSRLKAGYDQQKNFVSFATHELRTPLAILMGHTEVALMRDRSIEEYKNTLNTVRFEVKEINELLNDLLLIARANSDSHQVEFEAARIDDIVWQSRNYLLGKNKPYEINVGFEENFESERQLELNHVNKEILRIAMTNLMDNACKYSTNKTCEVKIIPVEKGIKIEFKDHGKGIPASEIEHIFEPFYRASHTKMIDGHGLGLPLVKRIMELHGGKVEIVSKEGEGSVFSLFLPY
ncbi:sensor histidine kinase [Lacihabitans sp. LS3-19]|uniref:HAMP domain-containing sensor histidine kinase n=1 Tax=Lacihabitans sp. LS3-19 TaxID=2487335 RepID=UPI0020CC1C6B|nr:HAMP domain-containing sensor histidine kinase [Lacihabitans sp. LS3-19]MCP9767066.1 sensor histidine kinase [Lacihabitans sp. LS3-19]